MPTINPTIISFVDPNIIVPTNTDVQVMQNIMSMPSLYNINYNTTNLKITNNQLNTIQDIATTSSPSFTGLSVDNMVRYVVYSYTV